MYVQWMTRSFYLRNNYSIQFLWKRKQMSPGVLLNFACFKCMSTHMNQLARLGYWKGNTIFPWVVKRLPLLPNSLVVVNTFLP